MSQLQEVFKMNDAIETLIELAEQGDVTAVICLAHAYDTGLGLDGPQDRQKTCFWFQKGAELGNADCQLNVGMMCEKGETVPQDYRQAAVWYRKAAEQGGKEAQRHLGYLYKNGFGVEQDYRQAYAWFSLAATKGDHAAIVSRDKMVKKLTPAALVEAQKLAFGYFELYRKS
jgi:TPR repeat protein